MNRWPDRRSSVYADTISTMSAASFTRSIDSCENRATGNLAAQSRDSSGNASRLNVAIANRSVIPAM